MTKSDIEAEILVQAPIEVVWRAVSEPERISSWFTDTAQIEVRPGGEGALSWDGRATNQPTSVRIEVVTVQPPERFSFRWLQPAGEAASERNSMLVEFAFSAEGDKTRIRVTETGLSEINWPEEQKASYVSQSSNGWPIHLAHLNDYVSRRTETR